MAHNLRAALEEGLIDAVTFVVGALAGWQFGRLLGFDAIAAQKWDARALVGLLFILAGLGLGKLAAKAWHRARAARLP